MTDTYVPFDIIRDDYCVYEVENGQVLKIRQSITDIVNTDDPDPNKQSRMDSKLMSSVIATKEIDTSNLVESTPDQTLVSDQTNELKFKIIKELVNIYETKKSIILVTSHVYKIFATTKKDKKGDPILRFRAVHDIAISKKSEFNDDELSKSDELNKIK